MARHCPVTAKDP